MKSLKIHMYVRVSKMYVCTYIHIYIYLSEKVLPEAGFWRKWNERALYTGIRTYTDASILNFCWIGILWYIAAEKYEKRRVTRFNVSTSFFGYFLLLLTDSMEQNIRQNENNESRNIHTYFNKKN